MNRHQYCGAPSVLTIPPITLSEENQRTNAEIAEHLGITEAMAETIAALIDWGDGMDTFTSLGISQNTYRQRMNRIRADTKLTTIQVCVAFDRLRNGATRKGCLKGFAR